MTMNQYTSAFFHAAQCELSAFLEPNVYGAFARGLDACLDNPRCELNSFAEDWFWWAFSELLRRQSLCGVYSIRVAWGLLDESTTPRGSYLWGAAASCLEPLEDACAKCARLIAIAMAYDGPECFETTLVAFRALCDLIGPGFVAQSIIFRLGGGDV